MDFNVISPESYLNDSKGELDLIDVLWRQDVDLGVGKEVYDHTLRLELEKEREVELIKQQEKQRAQELSREKEERQKQEQANRWLKQNYMQDGETGEWVRLQNGTSNSTTSFDGNTILEDQTANDDFLNLEAALDYISASLDPNLLKDFESNQQPDRAQSFTESFIDQLPSQESHDTQEQKLVTEQPPEGQQVYFEHQDSLEDNWNGLVSYLNMAANTTRVSNVSVPITTSLINSSSMATPEDHLNSAVALNSELNNMTTELDARGDFLLQNATMPSPDLDSRGDILLQNATMPSPELDARDDFLFQNTTMPSSELNITTDFASLTPAAEMYPTNSTGLNNTDTSVDLDSPMDWDLGDLSFFGNITSTGLTNIFLDMQSDSGHNSSKDIDSSMVSLEKELCGAAQSIGSTTPQQEFSDVLDCIEGAIGGTVLSDASNLTAPYSKGSHLSESSNDSGFAYQGGFSSSPSSEGSSYGGSPAGTFHGAHNSANSNDTDFDPKGSRVIQAMGRVAHNHTYNTPPGQTPREVKKYAHKEPSRKGPQSRDQRRASDLKVPFTIDEIIGSPVDTFNDLVTKYNLSETQLSLIRDIRRRGKNKVAAQNCRQRKVGAIVTLSDEMIELQKVRDRLVSERAEMERETCRTKNKFGQLYTHIFQSLRDEHGQPYDPNLYSLQQSSDGNVFLVPRNVTNQRSNERAASSTGTMSGSSSSSASPTNSSASSDRGFSRKRKSLDQ